MVDSELIRQINLLFDQIPSSETEGVSVQEETGQTPDTTETEGTSSQEETENAETPSAPPTAEPTNHPVKNTSADPGDVKSTENTSGNSNQDLTKNNPKESVENETETEETGTEETGSAEDQGETDSVLDQIMNAESATPSPTPAVGGEERTPGSLDSNILVLLLGVVLALLALSVTLLMLLRRKSRREEDLMYEDGKDLPDRELHTMAPQQTGNNAVKYAQTKPGCPFRVGTVHDVGKRSMQQDSFGYSDLDDPEILSRKGFLAVVADGMGGLSDGERMSQMVVVNMLQGFDESLEEKPAASLLLELVDRAANAVNEDLGPEKIGRCGSTVVAVVVKDNRLSYISVGDSHIYVWRDGQLIKINKDHNYAAELDELVKRGELTMEEAMSDPQRAALTSYIGMGEVELIDQNVNPIELMKGDRILLMSDGVYGTVGEENLNSFMNTPLRQACTLIDNAIHVANKGNQDNYTCIVIEIR